MFRRKFNSFFRGLQSKTIDDYRHHPLVEKDIALSGVSLSFQLRSLQRISSLSDVEFSVFSQWGEDGIIEWIIQRLPGIPQTFIEFGVEDYKEANTRFLLVHRNWRGLVIDGSEENVKNIKHDYVSWRHDLTSISKFITKDNINALINNTFSSAELGLLSVDIDGNDYWVWESIDCIKPWLVVAEYNSAFGDVYPITVPYRDDFQRAKAHFSNLYYGASIKSLEHLAKQKGYVLLGSNGAGSNAFFIREDLYPMINSLVQSTAALPSLFREGRNLDGGLSYISGEDRSLAIGNCMVVDVTSQSTNLLKSYGNLFSQSWRSKF